MRLWLVMYQPGLVIIGYCTWKILVARGLHVVDCMCGRADFLRRLVTRWWSECIQTLTYRAAMMS